MFRFLLPCLLLLLPSLSHANLEWESTSFARDADASDTRTEAVFKFTNAGEAPVLINRVSASCGCTTPSLEKTTYDPGETGEIKAIFDHGDRIGRQHKTITVDTSAGVYRLDLHVVIPELIKSVTPRILEWKLNEEPTSKRVTVRLDPAYPIEVARVQDRSRPGSFEVAGIHKIQDGVYEVEVRPVTTETPRTGSMVVMTNFPEEKPRSMHFLVRVR